MKVLFLCTENACRSQMAEALANHFFGLKVQAFSAGIRPGKVHPLALQVLQELGISTEGLRSKHLDEFKGEEFDLAITLCNSAKKHCPYLPGTRKSLHIPVPDPAPKGTLKAFREVRDLLLLKLKEIFASEGLNGHKGRTA